jgi:hypothetical protein
MDRRFATKIASVALAATVMLVGCATIRRSESRNTEQLLAAAGFRMQPADTTEQRKHLTKMPPYRLSSHTENGNVVYTYADPENCRCVYVGGPEEYSAYQRLLTGQQIQQIRRIQELPRHFGRAGEASSEQGRGAAPASRSTS